MVSQNKKVVYRKLFCWLTISNFLYIIVLLILAGISIAMLTGENGILSKAMDAKEETQIKAYHEKIELIRNELRLEKENYLPPTIAEMKNEFDNNQTDWVASTEIKQVDGIETLELKTKEGYIFHITETGTEYKGKGKVEVEKKLWAEEVSFTPEDEDWQVENVKEALDYLLNN